MYVHRDVCGSMSAYIDMCAYVLVCTFICTCVCKVCKGESLNWLCCDFLLLVELQDTSLKWRGLLCMNLPSIHETRLTSRRLRILIVCPWVSPDSNHSGPLWTVHGTWR